MSDPEILEQGRDTASGSPALAQPTEGGVPGRPPDVRNSDVVDRDPVGSENVQTRKTSFRDMVVGGTTSPKTNHVIPDLDVEVGPEDVVSGMVDGIPTIDFSARVHALIDSKLENSIIVRLLGRSIGFLALLNRIKLLWKPIGEIALVDMDNGYFLVRFANAEDMSKALSDGPWVIYGCYLTVQPWSRLFSTTTDHPGKIVVWVRLPGLPYRYYTRSIIRFIANAIGEVIRIDYNTEEGKRGRFARLAVVVDLNKPLAPSITIDGFKQKIEYEGLPLICFSCGKYGHIAEHYMTVSEPEPVYGSWMQVKNRKARRFGVSQGASRQGVSSVQDTSPNVGRFEILKNVAVDTNDHAGSEVIKGPSSALGTVHRGQLRIWDRDDGVLDERRNRGKKAAVPVVNNGKSPIVSSLPKKSSKKQPVANLEKTGESSKAQDGEQVLEQILPAIPPKDLLIDVPSVLDPKNHSAVQLVSNEVSMGSEEEPRRTIPRVDYGSGRTARRLSKIKSAARSNPYGPGKSNSGLTENRDSNLPTSVVVSNWIQTLAQKLDAAGKGDENPLRELEL
ncbi:hypothetical protein GQ457_10G023950 [Hibiscus cannabinus]